MTDQDEEMKEIESSGENVLKRETMEVVETILRSVSRISLQLL